MMAAPGPLARRLVVWCPDWPVVAATRERGNSPSDPTAVFEANRVLACSAAARSAGVGRGMRRRDAQGRCPELVANEHDPQRDARLFETVAAAVESRAPGVEIVRPGLVAVPAQGPSGYFGSEEAAAEHLVDHVGVQADVECQVGIADDLFTATLAARRGTLVPCGGSQDFLAPLGIDELDQPGDTERAELVDLLRRLGIRRLGEFATLPPGDVATRFGTAALLAHRAAAGRQERPPDRRTPPPDLVVSDNLDPPVERVDAAAFVAKALADRMHRHLGDLGLACTRLGITARTEHGQQRHRVWRCVEPLTPSATADRVRWQLDGWLSGRSDEEQPTAGICALSLRPEEVVRPDGMQYDVLHATTGQADDRAARALVRVQGMLGPDAVMTGIPGNGRDVRDRIRLGPWGEDRSSDGEAGQPWSGRLPAPSPSIVPNSPWPVTLLDDGDHEVGITDRNHLTAAPHRLVATGGRSRTVIGWAGPWPLDERWWQKLASLSSEAPQHGEDRHIAPPRLAARMQVVLDPDGDHGEVALLLAHEQDRWWVQGVYR